MLILCRLEEVWSSMADRLEELVYTDESKEMIDIINVLLIGWILLGLIVYIVGNIIANQLYKSKKEEKKSEETKGEEEEPSEEVSSAKPPLPSELLVNHKPKEVVEEKREVKKITFSVNGSDPDAVRWTNDLLNWAQSNPSFLVQSWIQALNENAKLKPEVKVNFEQVQTDTFPSLSDIKAEFESENKVIITCKVSVAQLNFIVTLEQDSETKQYDVIVHNLTGKLKINAMVEELILILNSVGQPDFTVTAKLKDGTDSPAKENKPSRKETIIKLVNGVLPSAVSINCSDTDIPHFEKTKPGIDFSKLNSTQITERLIIKLIKASNLGGTKGCTEPYCVVELDDPGQKFETLPVKNTNSPSWDNQLTFKLNSISSELLFEIYDKGKETDNFLGLGIVSLEELSNNQTKRHIIPLQSRPLEKDEVTGALTVEFSFVDEEGHPVSGLRASRIVETNSRVTAGGTVITTTTIKRTVNGKESVVTTVSAPTSSSDLPPDGVADTVETKTQDEVKVVDETEAISKISPTDEETTGGGGLGAGESVTDTALRELETRGKTGVPASKSTLIIHSVVAREAVRPAVKVKLDKNGRWHEVSQQDSPTGRSGDSTPSSPPSKQEGSSTIASTSSSASERDEIHRSRPKEKRSLMGTLRRRLSLRKTRSKSMEQKPDKDEPVTSNGRSVSADRSRSMPGSRETSSLRSSGNAYLRIPDSRTENDSTRSSISEASGISGASTRTFISDKSTLVIEANENGIIKRYLIPASLATRSKWRKKGIKLHIYNEHVFVAKHISGAIICKVCNKQLPRRPGKQGYECRDCKFQCHKPCHVKVEEFCPSSTINTMEVEYVQDTSKPKQS